MLLEDLIEYLALSDLGSTKLFKDKIANPDALYEQTSRDRKRLINHINDANMAICQELPLFWFSTVIRLVEGRTTYELNSKHSIRKMPEDMELPDPYGDFYLGMPEAEFYIYDSVSDPFEDNVLTIGRVTSELGLYDITIGNSTYKNAVMVPRPNTLELPEDMIDREQFVTVFYTGHIPKIPLTTSATEDYYLPLPESLKEAVAAHIAHKLLVQPQDTPNTTVTISYLERFNLMCDNYHKNNISNISGDVNASTFIKGGWV